METLQGITRRNDIKRSFMEQLGQQDVAYAASGVDLSFGTPGQVRKEAFRETDLGITSDNGTEQTRVARLDEREAEYRKRASRAKKSAMFDALTQGLKTGASIADSIDMANKRLDPVSYRQLRVQPLLSEGLLSVSREGAT